MSKDNMEFLYFKYPEKFAFLTDEPKSCSICHDTKVCFDAVGYSGINDIECICESCLKAGKLIDLEIEPNLIFDDGSEAANTITYKTPALPTWQDTPWPTIDGQYPIFECIVSKQDFSDKHEFLDCFIEGSQTKSDIEWLWDALPDRKLSTYKEGGDISVYLFSLGNKKYWVWDAN
ncbi:CbrC family protein [Shewanella algae]|uniref:CbrC family protein n=1 Tax=Shewanella algae TaxID=38313 RepID=UPI0031F59208